MVGRLRLWSGYALFFYVVTHLLNHTLGLISLRVLEAGRHWFVLIWHNPVGQTVLYGALFGHSSSPCGRSTGGVRCSCRPGNGRNGSWAR